MKRGRMPMCFRGQSLLSVPSKQERGTRRAKSRVAVARSSLRTLFPLFKVVGCGVDVRLVDARGGGGAGWTECMQEGGRREAGEERLRRPQIAEGETEEEEKKQRGSVRGRAKYEVGGERASCHGEGVVSPVTHSRGKAKDVSNAEDEALLYVHTVAGMYEYYVCLVYCM